MGIASSRISRFPFFCGWTISGADGFRIWWVGLVVIMKVRFSVLFCLVVTFG